MNVPMALKHAHCPCHITTGCAGYVNSKCSSETQLLAIIAVSYWTSVYFCLQKTFTYNIVIIVNCLSIHQFSAAYLGHIN